MWTPWTKTSAWWKICSSHQLLRRLTPRCTPHPTCPHLRRQRFTPDARTLENPAPRFHRFRLYTTICRLQATRCLRLQTRSTSRSWPPSRTVLRRHSSPNLANLRSSLPSWGIRLLTGRVLLKRSRRQRSCGRLPLSRFMPSHLIMRQHTIIQEGLSRPNPSYLTTASCLPSSWSSKLPKA